MTKDDLKALKNRKLVEERTLTNFLISKGESFRSEKVEVIPELTSAMISDGSWEKHEFKKFNP